MGVRVKLMEDKEQYLTAVFEFGEHKRTFDVGTREDYILAMFGALDIRDLEIADLRKLGHINWATTHSYLVTRLVKAIENDKKNKRGNYSYRMVDVFMYPTKVAVSGDNLIKILLGAEEDYFREGLQTVLKLKKKDIVWRTDN